MLPELCVRVAPAGLDELPLLYEQQRRLSFELDQDLLLKKIQAKLAYIMLQSVPLEFYGHVLFGTAHSGRADIAHLVLQGDAHVAALGLVAICNEVARQFAHVAAPGRAEPCGEMHIFYSVDPGSSVLPTLKLAGFRVQNPGEYGRPIVLKRVIIHDR
jgi:hypothetical protein